MGNGSVESGDGSHRGYGVLQLTGKDNQKSLPNMLKIPIL
jgi:predicted chitinase